MDGRSEQRALPVLEGDPRLRRGPSLDLVESKLRFPSARPGIVLRRALVDRLLGARTAPVICVVAPPGYGKTTALAQWVGHKGRRAGWVSVDRRDNDPVVLLSYIAVALDRVEPIDAGVFQTLAAPGVSATGIVVPRLVAAASAMTQPVALVLDNLELLDNQESLDAVAELALRLPPGSQVALASRRIPALPVALLRARGQVVEVGVAALAANQAEARALLEATGVALSDAETAELVGRTEGWPAGLYLAALALKAGARRTVGFRFTGDDRFMADYLRSELLAHLPTELLAFLTRTSVLERMCGPLCDRVLAARGSGRVLESLEDSNLLVVPLDRRREWYRYHQLFGELLLAELERGEPELVAKLHTRAAGWCEENALPEMAIDHARAAGDADRVARLVAGLVFPTYAGGRVDTVLGWLAWFEERGLVERYPPVAVLGAAVQALVGRPAAAERWANAAEHPVAAAGVASAAQMPPDGSTMEGYPAMLRSLLCRDGAGRMRADAPHDRRLGQLRARPLGTLRHRAGSHRDARPGGRVSREAAGDGQPLVARSRPVPGPAAGGPDGGGGPRRPHQAAGGPARDRYVYYPDAAEVPESAAVNIRNRSYTITVEVDIQSEDAAGVLFSHGARFGGHSLYVKDRKLKYVYNFVGSRDQTIQGVRDAVHLRNRWNHRPRANQRRCASCMDDGSTIRGRPGLITLGQDAVPARYSGCRWSASGRPRRRSAPLPRPAARETMRCPRVWKRRCPR